MNQLSLEKRAQIVELLVEGNSIRTAARIADVSHNTVMRLLRLAGKACLKMHHEVVRNLPTKYVQSDELWAYVHARKGNLPDHLKGVQGYGDVWTWIAIDEETRFVITWFVGNRRKASAKKFMEDLRYRVPNRFQLSTDKLKSYEEAIDQIFGNDIDYAQVEKIIITEETIKKKIYGHETEEDKKFREDITADEHLTNSEDDEYESDKSAHRRYRPGRVIAFSEPVIVTGDPDKAHISTSYSERYNLTVRMTARRFTRLTNAFSKKFENLCYQIAISFVYYNFIRNHKSLRGTPAMALGLADYFWEFKDIAMLTSKETIDKKPKALMPYNFSGE